jgi:hypothetical protein
VSLKLKINYMFFKHVIRQKDFFFFFFFFFFKKNCFKKVIFWSYIHRQEQNDNTETRINSASIAEYIGANMCM